MLLFHNYHIKFWVPIQLSLYLSKPNEITTNLFPFLLNTFSTKYTSPTFDLRSSSSIDFENFFKLVTPCNYTSYIHDVLKTENKTQIIKKTVIK